MTHNSVAFPYEANGQVYRGAYLAGGQRAGVVLLPDWRGQSDLAKDHARFLVDLDCSVVIADLYGDGFTPQSPDEVGPLVKRLMENRRSGVQALSACVDTFRGTLDAQTPIICIGFSAGGMVALDYARSGAALAGTITCSALLKTAESGGDPRIPGPVLILQGTQDQVAPMDTIDAVIAEMDEAGNDVRFLLFTQTHHAFDNPEAGDDPSARLVYSERSATRARMAMTSFILEVTN